LNVDLFLLALSSPLHCVHPNDLKKINAYKDIKYVESSMVFGLGTSSTVMYVEYSELFLQEKLTSKKNHKQALL